MTTTFLDSFYLYRGSLGLAASPIDFAVVLDAGWLVDSCSKVQQIKMVIGTGLSGKEVLAIARSRHSEILALRAQIRSSTQPEVWQWQASGRASSLTAFKKIIYDSLTAKFSSVLMIDVYDVVPDKALFAHSYNSFTPSWQWNCVIGPGVSSTQSSC